MSSNKNPPYYWIIIILIILSFAGFVDSSYLSFLHFENSEATCLVFGSCDKVLLSSYSEIASVPVALMGAVYYFVILVISAVIAANKKHNYLEKIILYVSILGFLASIYFVYLQIFVIKALCFYCLISLSINLLLFIFAIVLVNKTRRITPVIVERNY